MKKAGRHATPEERRLWAAAMKGVVPLAPADTAPEPDPPATPPAPPQAAPDPVRPPVPSPMHQPLHPARSGGGVPGLDRSSAERLRKGEMPIEARLDLHGMTREGAFQALHGFLLDQAAAGRRCVLVITGKGRAETGGVLKSELPHWLSHPALRPLLLARAQATPRHGGSGAVYLLLKRKR